MRQDASIFIGYRRRDSQGFAGRVADDLIEKFGTSQVFRDDDIREGSDFTHVLDQALRNCRVLIAVIGPNWLSMLDDQGLPRLHHPDDWVRREIEAAFDRGIWVLPVLVGNASMPEVNDLPDALKPISQIQAVIMTDRQWEYDLERLTALLKQRIPGLNAIPSASQALKPTFSIGEALERLIQTVAQKQTVSRSRPHSFARILGSLLKRFLWLGGILLVVWYLFENHATPQVRQTVFNFLAFAQDKAAGLIAWDNDWD